MERDLTRNVELYIQSLGGRQYSRMVDIFFLFSASLPASSLAECKNEMVRRLQAWDLRCQVPGLPYPEKSFNAIQDELVFFASNYGVSPVWTFFRMTRALTTMDASLRELIPEADFHDLINSYQQRRMARIREKAPRKLIESAQNFRAWFELQDRLLDDMRFRSGIVRRAAQVFERTTSNVSLFFSRMAAQLGTGVLIAAAVLFVIFLYQMHPESIGPWLPAEPTAVAAAMPPLDWQVWLVLFGILAHASWGLLGLSRRLSEQDVEHGGG
jgi:hypothetical protein